MEIKKKIVSLVTITIYSFFPDLCSGVEKKICFSLKKCPFGVGVGVMKFTILYVSFFNSYYKQNLVKIGPVVLEKKMLKDDALVF